MLGVLDDERLNGPHSCSIRLRPPRVARVVRRGDIAAFLATIELDCQLWGGAASPILPLDDSLLVSELYRSSLRGSAIDFITGAARVDDYGEEPVKYPSEWTVAPGEEFALLALERVGLESRPTVTVPNLAETDPWRGIYAACLGLLPASPSQEIIRVGRYNENISFDPHLVIDRTPAVGSLDDLVERLSSVAYRSPRALSMVRLAYGYMPNTGIRIGRTSESPPSAGYVAADAGPNVLVACSLNDVDDLSLLWNLRAAHADEYLTPIGAPADAIDEAALRALLTSEALCHQGLAHKALYMTSTSIPTDRLRSMIPTGEIFAGVAVVEPSELATIGPAPARHRTEVATWTNGRSEIVPVSGQDQQDLRTLLRAGFGHQLRVDVTIDGHPFPARPDLRVGSVNQQFFSGSSTSSFGDPNRVLSIEWPSRLLMLRSICADRQLEIAPSAAGLTSMTFLDSVGGISGLDMFAHAPLLALLDRMAQRMGTAWAKAHLRDHGVTLGSAVAPTEDDLPEVDFERFRVALGSVGAARKWLSWAEEHKVVVKGFPLECEACDAKQWVPVSGFDPPIICRGCARPIERPFPKEMVTFKYRLGEATRRVWEHDAIGHLLVVRYLRRLYRDGVIGSHPGLDISNRATTSRLGEADCLSMFPDGTLVPSEVKRSFQGATDDEVAKLDVLVEKLSAPWSIVAVTNWASEAPTDFTNRQLREGHLPHRILLTFDHLLEMSPTWPMGGPDPLRWESVSDEVRAKRESRFTKLIEGREDRLDFFESSLLRGRD